MILQNILQKKRSFKMCDHTILNRCFGDLHYYRLADTAKSNSLQFGYMEQGIPRFVALTKYNFKGINLTPDELIQIAESAGHKVKIANTPIEFTITGRKLDILYVAPELFESNFSIDYVYYSDIDRETLLSFHKDYDSIITSSKIYIGSNYKSEFIITPPLIDLGIVARVLRAFCDNYEKKQAKPVTAKPIKPIKPKTTFVLEEIDSFEDVYELTGFNYNKSCYFDWVTSHELSFMLNELGLHIQNNDETGTRSIWLKDRDNTPDRNLVTQKLLVDIDILDELINELNSIQDTTFFCREVRFNEE